MSTKQIIAAGIVLLLAVATSSARQAARSDESSHVLALDNSWNRALETKDTKALDMLLADTFVSIDIDGSMQNKREFLSSIKAPDYHPPAQAVTEQSAANVYGDSAVVVGIFRSSVSTKARSMSTASALPG